MASDFVIDIIGSLPIIISYRQKFGHIESEKASLVSLFIMILFLFVGESILKVIGIDIGSFAIAGSFVIFFLALEMILGIQIYKEDKNEVTTASIVPIAFPLIAGAGSMTTLLSLKAQYQTINIIIAIVINMILVYFILKSSKKLEQWLGHAGISILRKVFGIILLAIAVKLFKTNLNL